MLLRRRTNRSLNASWFGMRLAPVTEGREWRGRMIICVAVGFQIFFPK
jgi:hypothetical protein